MKEFQRNWKDLIHPKRIEKDEKVSTPFYGKFVCEPLEPGYGITLGNSIRRVLLSSIQGPAITSIKIDGVLHEFSTVPGVKEDVTEIILNLKGVDLKMHCYESQVVSISVVGPADVRACDIATTHQVEVVNGDQHIATVAEGGELNMEMTIEMGSGYQPVERRGEINNSIGTIPVDALFSPIKKVNYSVTNARVGRRTDYQKLTIEIWTNGTVLPEDALAYSAKILKQQLSIFINFDEDDFEEEYVVVEKNEIMGNEEILFTLVEDIDFSARSMNCLRKANIKYIGEVVQKTEDDLLNLENFGKRSLVEIKEKLEELELRLGMPIERDIFEAEKENREKAKQEV
ncbi:MAG: DNA-directed RNA polymerase subunit alpha [Thermodesulfobacteriota bacterium]